MIICIDIDNDKADLYYVKLCSGENINYINNRKSRPPL